MPNSETSFRDRQGKAQSLQDSCEIFTPAFVPADSSLVPINFQVTINGVDAANTSVETLASNYTMSSTERVLLVKTIRAVVTQALSFIKSNSAWMSQFKAAKMAADRLRGARTPDVTTPSPDPGPGTPPPAETAETAKRNKGQQAYVELAAHLQSFVNAVTSCAGYLPPATEITLVALNGQLTVFKGLNSSISTLDGQLTTARSLRAWLYFSPEGLQVKFQAVKDAVKGQYGQNSAQYATVKTIKW